MRLRWLVNCLMILGVMGGLFWNKSTAPAAAESGADKIEAALLDEFSTQGRADYIVRFISQADLSAAYNLDWKERGTYVVNALQETAAQSQAQAKGILDAAGIKYQTFIAGNELYVWSGDANTAEAIAEFSEVESIRQTRTYAIDPVVAENPTISQVRWAGDRLAYNLLDWVGESPSAIAWGISYTQADDFWTQFQQQGDGIVVANIDTGVQWDHPALDQSFRCGTNPSDAKCWADPSNICGGSACDNNGHGTHTMGTMVGDDDPTLAYQVGMAPTATWIACKGCESDSCSDYALNACADWILAPGGNAANRPHVVNNSWGGGGGDTWYQAKVNAWVAAGIFPAFSVGNSGSSCNTLGSPGDYQASFGTAAHDSAGNAGSFSSRGPSTYGHDPYTKPNIAAPGVGICSSVPGGGWSCGYSGTSMASPHSAGAIALLWSCNPSLVGQVDSTFQALQNTAGIAPSGNCGAPPDGQGNYTFGYGYLDILAAGINYCESVDKGFVEGYVTDLDSGEPIEGASISANVGMIDEQTINAITDPTGYYTMTLAIGTYDITAWKNGYSSQTFSVSIVKDIAKQQDFQLQWIGSWVEGPTDPTDLTRYDCVWFDDGSGASAYNQKVYCLGGRSGPSSESNEIWRFDPVTGSFVSTGDTMYESVSNYTANVVEDASGLAIYVIGGYDVDNLNAVVDYVQRYNPVTGAVTLVESDPMPVNVSGELAAPGACVSVLNKIYCFGGWLSSTAPYVSDETWEFDPNRPAGLRWEQIETANLSVARGYIQTAVQNNTIYAMGGNSDYSGGDLIPTTAVEALNVNNLAAGWTVLEPLPVATAEGRGFGFDMDTLMGGAQSWAGKVYVVGGGDWPSERSEVMEYDVASESWSQDFPELIAARRDHAGVFVPICTTDPTDGLPGMWVFGGRQGTDDPPYMEPEYYPMECYEPPQVIEVVKTVGLDPNTCADTNRLDLSAPEEVTYCFTLTNTSSITLTLHDLVDTHLGTLLSDFAQVMPPGDSLFITETITVSTTTINRVEWIAQDESGNTYEDSSYATVVLPGSYYVMELPVVYRKY